VSLGRLATGNSASTLLDEKGNEYVLAQVTQLQAGWARDCGLAALRRA
jgi:hypothetical protein